MGLLSPVIATLLADTKEYMAKMDEAEGKMGEFGASAEASGGKFNKFANTASTAILGVGAAITAFGIDKALKFQEGLDALQNQAGLTAAQADKLGKGIISISNATGQSTEDLTSAALTLAQAGIKGAQAQQDLNLAAKAAVVTNSSVANTIQAIVAAQTLQVAKGMSATELTGKLVAGSKQFVGGLQAEEQMLSGRVGVALAQYGLKLSTVTALGAEFAKVGLPSRSIASFASAFGNLENPTSTYAKTLAKVGLSQTVLVSQLRQGDLAGMLRYIKDEAGGSAAKLTQFLDAVFGKTGAAAGSVVVKNLQDFAKAQQQIAGAGSGSLSKGFSTASQQLGAQMKIIEARFTNSATEFGLKLLPYIKDVADIISNAMNYLSTHSDAMKAFVGTLATLFATALGLKIANLVSKIKGLFPGGSAAETAGGDVLAAEGGVAAETGAGIAGLSGAAIGGVTAAALAPFVIEGALIAFTKGNTSAGQERAYAMYRRGLGGSKTTKHTVTVTVNGTKGK